MKDVVVDGVEVQAPGPILVAVDAGAVRIGAQVRARPLANAFGGFRVDEELDLGGVNANIPAV